MSVYMTTATGDRTSGSTFKVLPDVAVAGRSCLKVLPDVRSPVAVVIYTDTHTYKQKVLLYSKFMFNSKATANGDCYVREYLKGAPYNRSASVSCTRGCTPRRGGCPPLLLHSTFISVKHNCTM